MKPALFVLAAVVIAAIPVYVYLNYYMFVPIETFDCGQDPSCIQGLETKKSECIPSSTIMEGRDGIVLMVNITREGDKCIRTERVLDAPESSYLVGHNVTCESGLSQLNKPESLACPGSLYDFVKPSGGEGGGGDPGSPPPPKIHELNCGIDDNACKDLANHYLQGCENSKIINTDIIWYPTGYWTIFINISRTYECWLYFEVLNAVNIPPAVPSTIIGMNMTCNISFSEFPIANFTSEWCSGEFFDYLQYLQT